MIGGFSSLYDNILLCYGKLRNNYSDCNKHIISEIVNNTYDVVLLTIAYNEPEFINKQMEYVSSNCCDKFVHIKTSRPQCIKD